MAEYTQQIKARLHDQCADDKSERKFVDTVVTVRGTSIEIHVDGYGTREEVDDFSIPLFLEFYDGCLQVVVWDDINQADPKIIQMEQARTSNRKDD